MTLDHGDVVIAACKATASVGCLSVMGILLAWRGILDQNGLKIISRLGQQLIIPCLTFTSISGNMSVPYFEQNWGLVAAGIAMIALGGLIGRLVVNISGARPTFRPWFVLACTFPNVFAIPLVFIEAICRGEMATTSLAEECIAEASTRLFTLIMFFPVLVYGFGAVYAKVSLNNLPRDAPVTISTSTQQRHADEPASSEKKEVSDLQQEELAVATETFSGGKEANCAPQPAKPSSAVRVGSCYWQFRVILLENPPVIATIAAIAVALLKPMREFLYGPSAPLQFVTNAVAVVGKAAPCVTNITMAASLGCQLMKLSRISDILGGGMSGISRWTLFVLVATKMLLIPAIYFTILTQVVDSLPEDRWYRLLLFIEAETPTANNVVLLANVLGESESAQILALCTVTQLVFFLPLSTVFTAAGLALTDDLKHVDGAAGVLLDAASATFTNISTMANGSA